MSRKPTDTKDILFFVVVREPHTVQEQVVDRVSVRRRDLQQVPRTSVIIFTIQDRFGMIRSGEDVLKIRLLEINAFHKMHDFLVSVKAWQRGETSLLSSAQYDVSADAEQILDSRRAYRRALPIPQNAYANAKMLIEQRWQQMFQDGTTYGEAVSALLASRRPVTRVARCRRARREPAENSTQSVKCRHAAQGRRSKQEAGVGDGTGRSRPRGGSTLRYTTQTCCEEENPRNHRE